MDPEINTLVQKFFAAISDFQILMFSLLGGLEPPTFRLTAERASRLRHKIDCRLIFYASFELCMMNFYASLIFYASLNFYVG